MKPANLIAYVILIGIILFLLWDMFNTPDKSPEIAVKERENEILRGRIDSLEVSFTQVLGEKHADSAKFEKELGEMDKEVGFWKEKADKAMSNPVVIRIREEVPEIDTAFIYKDSVISVLGDQNRLVRDQLQEERRFSNRLLSNQVAQNVSLVGINSNLVYVNTVLSQQNRKLTRQRNIFGGVGAAGIIYGLVK